jgi:AsmA-like C-terminal region
VNRNKIFFYTAAAIVIGLSIAGIVLATHWPFSQARLTQSIQESFPVTVTIQKFHSTFFPDAGCVAEGLVVRRLGASPDTPPIATVQRFVVQARYPDLFLRPGYLTRIVLTQFRIHVPPLGTPVQETSWKETPSTTRVGEIIADGSAVQIDRANSHDPLIFDIHTLKVASVSRNAPLKFDVSLHNPLPPGEIHSKGQFGPWNSTDPGQTAVAGHYTFQNADLSTFDGIAGTLSSDDDFKGVLQHIEANGSIDIPDFSVTRSKHAVHLTTDFQAAIDATNGDVDLQRVTSNFLNTRVAGKATIAGRPGQSGKTTAVDLSVSNGRVQDVLRLFVSGPNAPLNGVTTFRIHAVVPPGDPSFIQKVRLVADFGVAGGQFSQDSTQKNVDTLSETARGAKAEQQTEPQNPERVISNLAGHVELRDATATFTDLSFSVPGASTRMHGTFNLQNQNVDLHGTLKTDVELSQMTNGYKSVLLKPFDNLFKRKHAGAEVPVHLVGTYNDPHAGLDLPIKK